MVAERQRKKHFVVGRWVYPDGQVSVYDANGNFRWHQPDDRLVAEGDYKIVGLSHLKTHSRYLWDASNPFSPRTETGPGSGIEEAITDGHSGLYLSWDGKWLYTPIENPAFGVAAPKSTNPGRKLNDDERPNVK
jgi:hypothetical protein